jgi:hypothetical protein
LIRYSQSIQFTVLSSPLSSLAFLILRLSITWQNDSWFLNSRAVYSSEIAPKVINEKLAFLPSPLLFRSLRKKATSNNVMNHPSVISNRKSNEYVKEAGFISISCHSGVIGFAVQRGAWVRANKLEVYAKRNR